jgi:minimal CRISPR polymerase domain
LALQHVDVAGTHDHADQAERDTAVSDNPPSPDVAYVGFDGDHIGDRIVRALIGNDEAALVDFARSVDHALRMLQRRLEGCRYRILLVTGDGCIVYGPSEPALFRQLAADFRKASGATLSVGIGTDLRSCYLAMKYAKSLGGAVLVRMSDDELCPF